MSESAATWLDNIVTSAKCAGNISVPTVFVGTAEFVAASAPVLLRLVDVSKLRATFSVQESELPTITRGGAMRVQLSNGHSVEGTVEYVPPVADPETGWFMISVVIENSDTKIVGSRCQRLP
jgi:multidrug efflux pump subunit AcrA (membrane-fusion protein)